MWTGDKKLTLIIVELEFKVLKMDAITRGGKTERTEMSRDWIMVQKPLFRDELKTWRGLKAERCENATQYGQWLC